MEKREIAVGMIAVLIMAVTFYFLIYTQSGIITGFAVFTQNDQIGFNEGTYSNTGYSSGAVRLSAGQTSGTYTSKIFDASADSIWNNVSYSSLIPSVSFLYAVDVNSDVWNSTDSINWFLAKDDFNGEIGNAADTGFFNSSGSLFVIANQKVWMSSDLGVIWTNINDNYNGAEGQNAFASVSDKNDNLYIIEGGSDVWKSSDSGLTWSKTSAAFSSKTSAGLVVTSSNTLISVDVGADIWSSSDGIAWTKINDDYNGADGNDATAMAIDSNDIIYILDSTSVWKSSDSGLTWTKQTSDFDPLDAHLGISMASDSENNIYIIDGGEDVYISTDGISWTKQASNFNAGGGNAKVFSSTQKSASLIFQVRNCSQLDCSDGTWQNSDLNSINLTSRYFQYKVSFATPDSSVTPALSSINLDYNLINTPPSLNLILPAAGDAYGTNQSIPLKFSVSDADDNLNSCWYNLGQENITIENCQNTTFNVSGNGNYNLIIYANDSAGELSVDSAGFSVTLGSPTITLLSPINTYLNYDENIEFIYTATDTDLDYCELWGDFSGIWELNQTDVEVISGVQDSFKLNLTDSIYKWNIRCVDQQLHSAFNGNKTFYIDTINPDLTLIEPTGAKSSRSVSASWEVSDASPVLCVYNVYQGASLGVANSSVDCSGGSASFGVSTDADYVFNFYVNDSAGNMVSDSLSFSVSTSSPVIVNTGGGGSSRIIEKIVNESKVDRGLEIVNAGDIIMSSGEERVLQVEIKNNGLNFLNDCKLVGWGENAELVQSGEVKNIGIGEIVGFNFVLNIPELITELPGINLECVEKTQNIKLNIVLVKPDLNVKIAKMFLESKNELTVKYSVKSLSDKAALVFRVFSDDVLISEKSEEVLTGDDEKEIILDVSKAESGMLKVSIGRENETIIEEFFLYNKNSMTGFASRIFEGNVKYIGLIVIVFLVLAFFIIRRIFKRKRR